MICDLCPRKCKLDEGQTGFCGVRENSGGIIRSKTYGLFSSISYDPIEKKPLYHVKPGSSTLSFGSIGCNLMCPWCQNWSISRERDTRGLRELKVNELLELCKKEGLSTVTFTYNEPILNYEYITQASRLLKRNGIDTYLVTAGYINRKYLEPMFKNIKAVNIDLKSFSPSTYKKIIKGELETIKETIKYLVKQRIWTEITTLIVPEVNDGEDEITQMGKWIVEELGETIPLHLSAFHPSYKMLDRAPTSRETLLKLREGLSALGLKYIYIGNLYTEDGGTTKCPKCSHPVIIRTGFQIIKNSLTDGRCPLCNHRLDGIY